LIFVFNNIAMNIACVSKVLCKHVHPV